MLWSTPIDTRAGGSPILSAIDGNLPKLAYGERMFVSLIAAVALNGTIGRNNALPWQIRDDMRFFTNTTRGHVVITGRKNLEAMSGPLPDRTNVLVTRNREYAMAGVHVVNDVESALRFAEELGETEAFVIGGAELFHAAKPYAHRFYRTTVLAEVDGDVRYDDGEWTGWDVREIGRGSRSAANEHAFTIELLSRSGVPRSYRRR